MNAISRTDSLAQFMRLIEAARAKNTMSASSVAEHKQVEAPASKRSFARAGQIPAPGGIAPSAAPEQEKSRKVLGNYFDVYA